jgi:hypothetical protein
MSRRIITRQLQSQAGGPTPDTYFDKVVKYIPADINAAWIFVSNLIKTDSASAQGGLLWGAFAVGLGLTAAWTFKQTTPELSASKQPRSRFNRPAITQIIISTGAFAVWVFALGDPFTQLTGYKPLYGSLLLVFYTLAVGLITPSEQ